MAHHRCSYCRQEADIRHKYHGYLFCDACLARVLYRSPVVSWWRRAWSHLTLWLTAALRPGRAKQKALLGQQKELQRAMMRSSRLAYRGVLVDPLKLMPQKR
ncbi:hypothetical protein LCGC14_1572680 [marine sediment metagenome]|uniref:Uncharacterized protein n=1 Tax=marine sediment metagenome TaxID=412755 RepID=A0A0F9IJE0_9ZZZZ